MNFLPPEECDLKGFRILACVFKALSQDSQFEKGVLKPSSYCLYFTKFCEVLQTADEILVCYTWGITDSMSHKEFVVHVLLSPRLSKDLLQHIR